MCCKQNWKSFTVYLKLKAQISLIIFNPIQHLKLATEPYNEPAFFFQRMMVEDFFNVHCAWQGFEKLPNYLFN